MTSTFVLDKNNSDAELGKSRINHDALSILQQMKESPKFRAF